MFKKKQHTKFKNPSNEFLSSVRLINGVMKLSLPQWSAAAGCTRRYIVPQERIRFLFNAQIYDQTRNWNPIEQVLILIKISSLASPDPVPFRTLIGSRYNNRSVSLCCCCSRHSCACTSAATGCARRPHPIKRQFPQFLTSIFLYTSEMTALHFNLTPTFPTTTYSTRSS